MPTAWFVLVACMLIVYVILDGFDLGAGIIHPLVARDDRERRQVLAAIGPFWDGNEVWLLAAGGTLYLAFPALYAASFSGFYLPLTILLWLLILRGIGIEFRSHLENALWRSFFDFIFAASSLLLTVLFGAALGNVIRGVPLNSEGYFFAPLWTTFTVVPNAGILDWYTLLIGAIALAALTGHGSCYVAMKTEAKVRERARRVAAIAWWGMLLSAFAGMIATLEIRPQVLDNYMVHSAGIVFPLAVIASLAAMICFVARGRDKAAFFSTSLFIAAMMGGAAFALYPYVLPASTNPAYGLTVYNTAAADYGLRVGLVWWTCGMALAVTYFAYLFHSFRGKVEP